MEQSIKEAHEQFVSHHDGSIAIEVLIAVFPIVPGSFLAFSFSHMTPDKKIVDFCLQFILCVVPLILSFTIFNSILLEFNVILMLFVVLRMTYLSMLQSDIIAPITTKGKQKPSSDKILFVTSCRATIYLASIIAILAVDFKVFPRRFAKTEEYGYSLMDIGAPCYILINAGMDSKYKRIPKNNIRNILVLLCLGFIRLCFVSLTHYQHHVTEYGLHANFFFVLAFMKVACCCAPLLPFSLKLVFGVLIAAIHQSNLNSGLASWTLSQEPRNTFLAANREFVVSMPGYIELYLFGSAIGDYVLQGKANFRLLALACMGSYGFLFVLETVFGFRLSRRLINPSFVLWVMGFSLLYLTLFYLADKFEILSSSKSELRARINKKNSRSLVLLEAINNSSLLFFLLGNVFTGLINLSIDTLEVNNSMAILIITAYMLLITAIVFIIDQYKTNRKVES